MMMLLATDLEMPSFNLSWDSNYPYCGLFVGFPSLVKQTL
jgi:hypothetical protein